MRGDTLEINMVFDDPVDNPIIRQDGLMDGLNYNELYNPIIGYYGNVRIGNDGLPKKHHGFDYSVKTGTTVKAVHGGVITKVRIGRYGIGKTCRLRSWLVENNNRPSQERTLILGNNTTLDNLNYQLQKDVCKQCKYKKRCFGLQLWLRISEKNNIYAYYAHLSGLDDRIWSIIKNRIDNKVFDYEIGISVEKSEKIGYSGCTGNACEMKSYQEHLHFECRKNNAEYGSDTDPNSIVKTKFFLEIRFYELLQDRNDIETVKKLFKKGVITETDRNTIFESFDNKKHLYITKH